jgi:uncharacterized protein
MSNHPPVLILPGWQNSGPGHWQSRWEAVHGYARVEQHDWQRPLRGDWTARLEDVLLACPAPAVLVAHSLGCIQAAWWAAHSGNTGRVKAALLVAPPDIERDDLRQALPGWVPVARQPLPFPSVLVASSDDPYGSFGHASQLAAQWGSTLHSLGGHGHINAESGLHDWPEGHALLQDLLKD